MKDYATIAENQRQFVRRVADALEQGEPLDFHPLAPRSAAGILRAWADALPD